FEDSPDRLYVDVEKAKVKRDREESVRVLAEARKSYAKGDYESATRLAYRAEKLHGPYSIWDLGDRPSRVIEHVREAKAKNRNPIMPDRSGPPTALVKNQPGTGPQAGKPGVGVPGPAVPGARAANTAPRAGGAPADGTARLRAQNLVAEAQRYQREGKLLEARQKAIEAQRVGATFAPNEVGPELVYQQVALEARQRVDTLMRQASDGVAQGAGDTATRCRQAEARLNQARELAAAFGHDVQPIDRHLAEVRGMKTGGVALASHSMPELPTPVPPPPAGAPPVTTTAPAGQGQMLLENARMELRKGETGTARRMAEEALAGNH